MLIRQLNKLRKEIPTLWYENEDGVRWIPDFTRNEPPVPPKDFVYQWSQFPAQVEETCLQSVLRSEVDECDHDPEFIKRTSGWIDGVRGRECQKCHGTQVVNDEDYPDNSWPDEWDACGSRPLMVGHTGYPTDLVMAMLRPSAVEIARQILRYGIPALPYTSFTQAVLTAKTACEACLNALCHRYGLKDGYRKGSKEWKMAGTSCDLCNPNLHKTIRQEFVFEETHGRYSTKHH